MGTELSRLFDDEGLVFLGVTALEREPDFSRFQEWLSDGRHAQMSFLERNLELRADPRGLEPGSRRALVFALSYDLGDEKGAEGPRIAQYARLPDYHGLLWKKGERIVERLRQNHPEEKFRVVVDSAPVLERALAARTKRGFIGKNTCYIHPDKGSFLLLGEILTSLDLPVDTAPTVALDQKSREGGCGPCDRCQVACPTGALDEAYRIDANRCLAYWTIENRGTIPFEYWPHLAKYYFGCDLCQLACPYNMKTGRAVLPDGVEEKKYPGLFETATMDQREYEKYFAGTPLTRAKRNGLRRNALIAMAVTKHPRLEEAMATADREAPVAATITQIRAWQLNSSSDRN